MSCRAPLKTPHLCAGAFVFRAAAFARGAVLLAVAALVAVRAQTIPTSGLVGYWAANGNANDSSTFANHGSFSGPYGTGISGQAFQVSASNYVSSTDAAHYAVANFSVGFWFNGSAGGALVGQDNGPGQVSKWFVDYGYLNAGVFNLHLNGTAGLTILSSDAVSPSSSAWHSFALVKNGTSFTFHLDGTAIGTRTSSATIPDPTAAFTIGFAEPAVGSFNGLMDEVVFYDRALTNAEVQQLAAIPEPMTSAAVLGAAALGLGAWSRRRTGQTIARGYVSKHEGALCTPVACHADVNQLLRRLQDVKGKA